MATTDRRRAIGALALTIAALGILHWTVLTSLVQGWLSSTTYTHGFAIPLVAAFFAWRSREQSLQVQVATWWPGLLVMLGLTLVWTIGSLINVQVVIQLGCCKSNTVDVLSGFLVYVASGNSVCKRRICHVLN